jgi:hypothetical protein
MRRKTGVRSPQAERGVIIGTAVRNGPVLVRPIRLGDFPFIQGLSATIDGYTVPPSYILWMLGRFQSELCLIAEDSAQEPLGYMLAMSAGLGSSGIFIWQLATNFRGQRLRAGSMLANHVRKLVKKHCIEQITFTAVPDSAGTRAIASLAKQMFGRTLTKGARLPRSISASECEFHLLL